jgi:MFS family permease
MSMGEVLRIPTMRGLWYAQLVSSFGDFLALFAVIGVLTFTLHATPQQVTGVQISYLLPIAILAVAGIVVHSNALIQQETPAALMGRVGSTVMSLVFTAQICGLVLSGLIADRIGVRHVFALCAILLACLIAAGRLWMDPRYAEEAAAGVTNNT